MKQILKTIARARANGESALTRDMLELLLELREAVNGHRDPEFPEIPEFPEFPELPPSTGEYFDPTVTGTYNVGPAWWMYGSAKEAVEAINASADPPSQTNRKLIYIWPGYYEWNETVEIPGDVVVQGVCKRATTLYNATTDMFKAMGPRVYLMNLCLKGALAPSLYLVNGNNQNDLRLDSVDMVTTSGNNTEKFLRQEGATWNSLILEQVDIVSNATSGYLILLNNTSGTGRNLGVQMVNTRMNMWSLTSAGGLLDVVDGRDIDLRNCHVRGHATYAVGARFRTADVSSGLYAGIMTTRFTCATALSVATGYTVSLFNSYAKPVTGSGTITAFNSTYT